MKKTCTCRAGLAGLAVWTTLACAGGIGRMAWDVTGDCVTEVRDRPEFNPESQDLMGQYFRQRLCLDLKTLNLPLKFNRGRLIYLK